MRHWLDHSLVLASDFSVSKPDRVEPLLRRRRDAMAGLGAHHALVYESTTNPGRVLVMIAIHTREPVLELLRSRTFFEWFDAVGVEDLPAVFAGELVERLELDGASALAVPEVIVSMVTPVEELEHLRAHVRATADDLARSGIRKLLMFSAFDDPSEVMVLLQIDDQAHARTWLTYSDLAHDWLTKAGIGAYPPVFVGRFRGMVRIEEEAEDDGGLADDP